MLFLYTATFDRYQGTSSYLSEFPGLGESAAEWIVTKGVKTFGVDSPTPDNPTSKSYPCHMMCRREHITHYENLRLTDVVGTRFTFVGVPAQGRGRPRWPHPGRGHRRRLRTHRRARSSGLNERRTDARWADRRHPQARAGGSMRKLTLAEADQIIDAALAKGRELGLGKLAVGGAR